MKSDSVVRTLADLARVAGVDTSTVSRALAGSSLVRDQTRQRIQEIAAAHNFRPNLAARRLRLRKAHAVSVVIPRDHAPGQRLSDPFFMTMFGHLLDRLNSAGYDVTISRATLNSGQCLEEIANSGLVDGILVVGQSDQSQAIERLAEQYLPLVVWGEYEPHQRHCVIGTDNRAGGRMAARHLVDQGARSLAFFGNVAATEFNARYQGFCDVAHEMKLPLPAHFNIPLGSQEAADAIGHLGKILRNFDGIACASDTIAQMAVAVAQRCGISVPSEMRIIGYDDLPTASSGSLPLSTIRQDLASGADKMVEALFARIAGHYSQSLAMEPQLVVRLST